MTVNDKHYLLNRDSLPQPIQMQLSEKVKIKIVAIWIAAPLEYLLITVKVVALEKVSFGDIQNPKGVC